MNLNKLNKLIKKNYVWIIVILILIIIFYVLEKGIGGGPAAPSNIGRLTDNWIKAVTVDKDPNKIYNMFSSDGILLGTVSKITRRDKGIKKYFDYFAKLPGLKVVDKKYDISKITNNVFINNALLTWQWEGQEPLVANMVFIYRGDKIFYLNSNTLPALNEALLKVSGEK